MTSPHQEPSETVRHEERRYRRVVRGVADAHDETANRPIPIVTGISLADDQVAGGRPERRRVTGRRVARTPNKKPPITRRVPTRRDMRPCRLCWHIPIAGMEDVRIPVEQCNRLKCLVVAEPPTGRSVWPPRNNVSCRRRGCQRQVAVNERLDTRGCIRRYHG